MTDNDFIKIAIDISKKAKYPYGAIIVKDGNIIGRSDADNRVNKTMYNHAELVAIEDASKNNLYEELKGCTLYTSCEPCMMCMGAVFYEGIEKLVYAATLEDSNNYIVKEVLAKTKDLITTANSNIEIIPELERDLALEVLKNYEI